MGNADIRNRALIACKSEIYVLYVVVDRRDAVNGNTKVFGLHGDNVPVPLDRHDAIHALPVFILPDVPALEALPLLDLHPVFDVIVGLPVFAVQPKQHVLAEIRAIYCAVARREYADERAVPHQTRCREAHHVEGERHAAPDRNARGSVGAPAVHLDIREVPLGAILDVADLLGNARDVVRADLHPVALHEDVVDAAMFAAECDIAKSRGIRQRQDDLEHPRFIRNPDKRVIPKSGGCDFVALPALGLAEAGPFKLAFPIEPSDLGLPRVLLRNHSVEANPGILKIEQISVVFFARMNPAVQRIEYDQRRQTHVLRESVVRLAAQADTGLLSGDGDALGAVSVDAFAAHGRRRPQVCAGCRLLHTVFGVQVDHMDHDLGKVRIKLRPDALDQLLSHDVLGNGVAVAAVGGHGVVGIRHGDDPRDLGDGLALEPFGIASSVVPLVVITRADREPRGLLDAGQDLASCDRMSLDLLEFFVSQPALLG